MKNSEPIKLMDIAEVSRFSGLSQATIYRRIGDGQLRSYKVGGRTKIKVEDYNAWIESQAA